MPHLRCSRSSRAARLALLAGSLVPLLATANGCSSSHRPVGQPVLAESAARTAHPGKRILIVVSSHDRFGASGAEAKRTGYWLGEVTHFYDVLARHGFEIDFVSPEGSASHMDPDSYNLRDRVNRSFWENPGLREKLARPLSPAQIDPRRYAAIYYAGGHGTMWDFPAANRLSAISTAIFESGGVVSAVCHGPSGLLNIKLSSGEHLIRGRKVTGFANIEESLAGKRKMVPFSLQDMLRQRGGSYSRAAFPFATHVVIDGRLVTGQNPLSAGSVGEAVVRVLAQSRAQLQAGAGAGAQGPASPIAPPPTLPQATPVAAPPPPPGGNLPESR